jgi:hypothetical protein
MDLLVCAFDNLHNLSYDLCFGHNVTILKLGR